ncbi:hypothetical protein L581_4150 [Serratia fonticola AU-AP2C]|nr:hypothetical protein L581_4150 [Serratia fonticola AU-AP2C]
MHWQFSCFNKNNDIYQWNNNNSIIVVKGCLKQADSCSIDVVT